jgi:hypothetical protein
MVVGKQLMQAATTAIFGSPDASIKAVLALVISGGGSYSLQPPRGKQAVAACFHSSDLHLI